MSENESDTSENQEFSKLGWLQQFERFGVEEFNKLREVANSGLTPSEVQVLLWTAKELIFLAKKYEPEALEKVKALLNENS